MKNIEISQSPTPEWPKLEICFRAQKKYQSQQQQYQNLNIELLRLECSQKKVSIPSILKMDQRQLTEFFINYTVLSYAPFDVEELKQSTRLKLIRNDGRVYFGEVFDRKMWGIGICYYREGKIYEGQFVANKKQGQATEIYNNGNVYIGNFLANKKHGWGQYYWFHPEEQTQPGQHIQFYEGQWWGGLPDGKGTFRKTNGDLFQGTFKNGLKHGFGSEKFNNGDFYKGQYMNGLPEGIGEYSWKDGAAYKGDFKQGLRSGYGIWKLDQQDHGERYQGKFAMDRKSGYGEYFWASGWVYKGNFQNDFRDGYGELFKGDNLVFRGQWRKGEKIPGAEPSNTIKISRLQLKNELKTTQKQVQVSGIGEDINTHDPPGISRYNQHQLLVRPGFTIRKYQTQQRLKKSVFRMVKHDDEYQSTFSSRIGREIQRPISKTFCIKSSRNLKQSHIH